VPAAEVSLRFASPDTVNIHPPFPTPDLHQIDRTCIFDLFQFHIQFVIAMGPRRSTSATTAEISLTHLKNCLVNLPSSLASSLLSLNTVSPSTQQMYAPTSLTVPAYSKCDNRAFISPYAHVQHTFKQWRKHHKINLCRLDRRTKQGKAKGCRRSQWDSRYQR